MNLSSLLSIVISQIRGVLFNQPTIPDLILKGHMTEPIFLHSQTVMKYGTNTNTNTNTTSPHLKPSYASLLHLLTPSPLTYRATATPMPHPRPKPSQKNNRLSMPPTSLKAPIRNQRPTKCQLRRFWSWLR